MFSSAVYDTTLDWLAVFDSTGTSFFALLAFQPSQQPRVSPLWAVVADRDASSRYPCVIAV